MPSSSPPSPTPTRIIRSRPGARKLDQKAALRDQARGLTVTEIAHKQGVAVSTAWRWLERMAPERKALHALKAGHSDALIHLHGLALAVKERILRSLDDGVIAESTPAQKAALLIACNVSAGTDFDKSRLLDGASTANLGVLATVIHEVHTQGVHRKAAKVARIENEPRPNEIIALDAPASDNSDYDNSVDMSKPISP